MATAQSRQYFKSEHRRVSQLYEKLEKKHLAMREKLNNFADSYIVSEELFPWNRSKVHHELVQSMTTDSIMQDLLSCIEESNIFTGVIAQPRASIPDLLAKVEAVNALRHNKSCSGQGQAKSQGETQPEGQGLGEKRPLIKTQRKSIFQKIKKVSGFDDNPIEDEDVMTNERLEFCRQTKEKQIKTFHEEFVKVHAALNKLSRDYSAARAQCLCCRYCTVQRIIETALDETDAYTHSLG